MAELERHAAGEKVKTPRFRRTRAVIRKIGDGVYWVLATLAGAAP